MAIPKQKRREALLVLLFSYEEGVSVTSELKILLSEELKLPLQEVDPIAEDFMKLAKTLPEVDEILLLHLDHYPLESIGRMEKNILRLGLFELFIEKAVPPKVAIAEALRLAKKFATPSSIGFINAVLDHAYKKSIGEVASTNNLSTSIEEMNKSRELIDKVIENEERKKSPSDPE